MARVRFDKRNQRRFLKEVMKRINCPTLAELRNRGFEISYSTLKNYFSELRLLPEDFFKDLCRIAGVDKKSLSYEIVKDNWGQVKGGKKSKR
jgi:hypothetical protein